MKTLIQMFLSNTNKMCDSEIRTRISLSVFLTQVFRFFFFFANADIKMGNKQSVTITHEKVPNIYVHLLKLIASAYELFKDCFELDVVSNLLCISCRL